MLYEVITVVGVNWKQATAFCIWRTQLLNNSLRQSGQPVVMAYRLPNEAEWEYASVITSYSIHYTKLYEMGFLTCL